MGELKDQMNRKFWDGLHEFSPKCYTCVLIETGWCICCSGNGSSADFNWYTGTDEEDE
jgi:hypothetical protein